MSGVYIVSDSSCDLEEDETDLPNVEIVPLSIRFGQRRVHRPSGPERRKIYKRMANSDVLPQTACPSPGAFERAFRNAVDAGANAVICLNISSLLSNTFQSARTAAAACKRGIPIHVIDSRSVSSGLGTLVLEAAKAAVGGAESVLRRVGDLIPRTHVIAALNTLENLKKGGRIGGAKALVGSILSIKPLIDITGGAVQEAGQGSYTQTGDAMALRMHDGYWGDRACVGDAQWCTRHRRVPRPDRSRLPPRDASGLQDGRRRRHSRRSRDDRRQLDRHFVGEARRREFEFYENPVTTPLSGLVGMRPPLAQSYVPGWPVIREDQALCGAGRPNRFRSRKWQHRPVHGTGPISFARGSIRHSTAGRDHHRAAFSATLSPDLERPVMGRIRLAAID